MQTLYPTDPGQIAQALRRLADDVDTLAGTVLPELWITVNVQVAQHGDPEPVRRIAVDTLIGALIPGAVPTRVGSSSLYGTLGEGGQRDWLTVAVYTAAPDYAQAGDR